MFAAVDSKYIQDPSPRAMEKAEPAFILLLYYSYFL